MRDVPYYSDRRRALIALFCSRLLYEEHLFREGFSARCISVKIHAAFGFQVAVGVVALNFERCRFDTCAFAFLIVIGINLKAFTLSMSKNPPQLVESFGKCGQFFAFKVKHEFKAVLN